MTTFKEEVDKANIFDRTIYPEGGVKEVLLDHFKDWTKLPVPVIPAWMDDEIKRYKSNYKHPTVDIVNGVADVFVKVSGNSHLKLYDYLFCGRQDECNQHQAIFALAYITGNYKIKENQLFYLKNKLTHKYLLQNKVDGSFDEDDQNIESAKWQTMFTQKEIDTMDISGYIKTEVD